MIKGSYLSVLLVSSALLVSGCGGDGGGSNGGNPDTNGDIQNLTDDTGNTGNTNTGDDTGGNNEETPEPKPRRTVAAYQFETDTRGGDRDGISGAQPVLSSAPPSCRPEDGSEKSAVNQRNYRDLPLCSQVRWENANFKGLDTWIDASVFVPEHKEGEMLPVVLHSHGWGGRKLAQLPPVSAAADASSLPEQVLAALHEDGYIVVSFSQRGWGESEGDVMGMNPYFETQDAIAVLDWIAERGREGQLPVAVDEQGDFSLALIGSSYGGGFQLPLAALDPRPDALVPMDAWHSMEQSLMPNGTVKGGSVSLLCLGGMHSGNYHPYLARACSDVSPATGLLWGLLNPVMPLLSDYFDEDVKIFDLPRYGQQELFLRLERLISEAPQRFLDKMLQRLGAEALPSIVAIVQDINSGNFDLARYGNVVLQEALSQIQAVALEVALEDARDSGVSFDGVAEQILKPDFIQNSLVPLAKPLVLSSEALANFEPKFIFDLNGTLGTNKNTLIDLVDSVYPNPSPARRFADELDDPQGEIRGFLSMNGLSYLQALEQEGRSFWEGGAPFTLRPLDVLLVHGMSDTLFPVREMTENYRYLSGKGGDVRVLTHQAGHVNPLAQSAKEGLSCGDIDIVQATRQWVNARIKGDEAAGDADLPKVCWSLDQQRSVALESVPGMGDNAAESGAMMAVTASVADGEENTAQCQTVYQARGEEVLAGIPRIRNLSVTGEGRQQAQLGLCLRRGDEVVLLGDQLMGFDSQADQVGDVTLSGVGAALQPGDEVGLYVTAVSEYFNFLGSEATREGAESILQTVQPAVELLEEHVPGTRLGSLIYDGAGLDNINDLVNGIIEEAAPIEGLSLEKINNITKKVNFDIEQRLNTLADELNSYSNVDLLSKLVDGAAEYIKAPEAAYTVSGNLILPLVPEQTAKTAE